MKGRFERNGVSLHYEILGDGDPVVFLNGVMMTAQSWVLQTALMRKSHRCVLHDFRGQLLSDKPDEPFSMETHADDLEALLDHLGLDSCHLVGTSYGGKVGLIFAATRPDRVRSLSVISASADVGPKLRRIVESWARTALDNPEELYRSSLPWNYSDRFLREGTAVLTLGEERFRSLPAEFFTALPALVEAFCASDVSALLPRITCPTLVMCGSEDLLKPPESSRKIAEGVPAAELLVVPGGGHALVIERSDEVNTALLGFLAKHGSERFDRQSTPPAG